MSDAPLQRVLETDPRGPEAFTLLIDSKIFQHWTEVELEQPLDGFASVGFKAPFHPERRELRDAFRPFSFAPVKLYLGTKLQFTGTLFNVEPDLGNESRSVTVQCVSLPSVLADCCMPGQYVGKQFSGLGLRTISKALCAPFGFTSKFLYEERNSPGNEEFLVPVNRPDLEAKANAALARRFKRVKVERETKVHDFLCTLTKQCGVIMTDDAEGNLVFALSTTTGKPVVQLEEGQAPLLSVKPEFSPKDYFSEVTAHVPPKRGKKGARHTLKNPFLKYVVRPISITCPDIEPGGEVGAAQAYLGRMFGNMASYEIELPTFFDPLKRPFRPNTTLKLRAPGAMIYADQELLIRSVTKRQSADATSCTLNVVLPGAFSGEAPSALPWNEPKN